MRRLRRGNRAQVAKKMNSYPYFIESTSLRNMVRELTFRPLPGAVRAGVGSDGLGKSTHYIEPHYWARGTGSKMSCCGHLSSFILNHFVSMCAWNFIEGSHGEHRPSPWFLICDPGHGQNPTTQTTLSTCPKFQTGSSSTCTLSFTSGKKKKEK